MSARAVLAVATVCVAFGAGTAAQGQTIPADTVAWVGETPILKDDYDHWYEIAAAGARDTSADAEEPGSLRRQVVQLLISYAWLRKEAASRGVHVARKTVLRRYMRIRRASFPTRRSFERFLAESRQTPADLKLRVRMELLSDRLRARAVRGARTPAGQQRRLDRFVRRFHRRWRAQTVCGEEYASDFECGSVVPIARPAG